MSASDTRRSSETNWDYLDGLPDDEIDISDIPPLDDAFFVRARLRVPTKRQAVTVHVDDDVLAWYHAQGKDWEARIRAALRIYAEAHEADNPLS